MSRNAQSHFATLPRADISRSTFERSSSVKLTFNVGDIIPFYVDEVLPGDSFHVRTSKIVRMQTLLTPLMDNIYLDTYYFFVPNRLVWEHWREFNGENTQSAWLPETQYEVPQITSPTGGWNVGTIADYMGIPTGVAGLSVNALPFRAYSLVMNEWFRDENLTDPLVTPVDDATVQGVNTGNYIQDVAKGGLPFKAAKYHDYFTSALPAPQKGPDVMVPVAAGADSYLPVSTPATSNGRHEALKFSPTSGTLQNNALYSSGGNLYTAKASGIYDPSARAGGGVNTEVSISYNPLTGLYPSNLFADFSSAQAVSTSINSLRMAFQIQKMYEKDARGGTRYIEILKSHFGVTSPDARLQRPEYLGGNRIPININQVVQNSETTSTSPQGNTAAYSLTSDSHSDFRKSFVEHGFVLGLMVARYDHTYQQGIERFWSRKSRFDYYWPVFANIGEQAIKNKEIFAQGKPVDDEVFGYQEAWADYRYKPSRVCGEMRSSYAQSLDVWHLADYYQKLPSLSDAWIREDGATVDRVLAVSSRVSAQLFADIFIQNRSTRPMPVYSVPGLVDHH